MREKYKPSSGRQLREAINIRRLLLPAVFAAGWLLPTAVFAEVPQPRLEMADFTVGLEAEELASVRGAGLGVQAPAGPGAGQRLGVILWDELKRNRLGQAGSGATSVSISAAPSALTSIITTAY